MKPHAMAVVLAAGLAAGCSWSPAPSIDRALLHAAWTSDGGSFDFVIGEHTILYEFDMREHPYTLEGNILVIDFLDPTLGVQRKEIVRLTTDELELRDVDVGGEATLFRHVE